SDLASTQGKKLSELKNACVYHRLAKDFFHQMKEEVSPRYVQMLLSYAETLFKINFIVKKIDNNEDTENLAQILEIVRQKIDFFRLKTKAYLLAWYNMLQARISYERRTYKIAMDLVSRAVEIYEDLFKENVTQHDLIEAYLLKGRIYYFCGEYTIAYDAFSMGIKACKKCMYSQDENARAMKKNIYLDFHVRELELMFYSYNNSFWNHYNDEKNYHLFISEYCLKETDKYFQTKYIRLIEAELSCGDENKEKNAVERLVKLEQFLIEHQDFLAPLEYLKFLHAKAYQALRMAKSRQEKRESFALEAIEFYKKANKFIENNDFQIRYKVYKSINNRMMAYIYLNLENYSLAKESILSAIEDLTEVYSEKHIFYKHPKFAETLFIAVMLLCKMPPSLERERVISNTLTFIASVFINNMTDLKNIQKIWLNSAFFPNDFSSLSDRLSKIELSVPILNPFDIIRELEEHLHKPNTSSNSSSVAVANRLLQAILHELLELNAAFVYEVLYKILLLNNFDDKFGIPIALLANQTSSQFSNDNVRSIIEVLISKGIGYYNPVKSALIVTNQKHCASLTNELNHYLGGSDKEKIYLGLLVMLSENFKYDEKSVKNEKMFSTACSFAVENFVENLSKHKDLISNTTYKESTLKLMLTFGRFLLFNRVDCKKAVESFKKLLNLVEDMRERDNWNPQTALIYQIQAHLFMGKAHYRLSEYAKTKEYYDITSDLIKTALTKLPKDIINDTLNPLYTRLFRYFGAYYRVLSDESNAVKYFTKAFELESNNHMKLLYHAEILVTEFLSTNYKLKILTELKNIIEAIETMPETFSYDSVIYSRYAAILLETRDLVNAEKYLDKAKIILNDFVACENEMHPEYAKLINMYGSIWLAKNKFNPAKICYEKALDIYQYYFNRSNYSIIRILYNLFRYYSLFNNISQTRHYASRVEKFFKDTFTEDVCKSSRMLLSCYNDLAEVYRYHSQFDLALDYYNEADIINNKIGSKSVSAMIYNNQGEIHLAKAHYVDAKKCFDKALSFFNNYPDLHHPQIIEIQTKQLEINYRQDGMYFDSIEKVRNFLKIVKNGHKNFEFPLIQNAYLLQLIGELYYDLGHPYAARMSLLDAKNLLESTVTSEHTTDEITPHPDLVPVYIGLTRVFLVQGNLNDANTYAQAAFKLALKNNSGPQGQFIGDTYFNLARLAYFNLNLDEAVLHAKNAKEIYQKLFH
ncbi:MAG: tetratricopeptide repeat protein, partial [Gammaproteobacteria bacterium]